jgi:hypothetical protein
MYMPWWLYQEQLGRKIGFPRGYHIEIGGGRMMPRMGVFDGLEDFTGGSYGRKFKQDARRYYGSFVDFAGRGEMIPNEDSYCELHPEVKDAWGLPVLRFHFKWSAHEEKQAAHMQKTFAGIIEAMGGKVVGKPQLDGKKAIAPGGSIIHEVGTTCMGSDPKKSVLNQYCQAWDVKNLFVTDAAETLSVLESGSFGSVCSLAGYGSDQNLMEAYKPGDLWPLTFTPEQRRAVAALCDLVIPADEESPSASQLQVPDFIDEWISAPYPRQQRDRQEILHGLVWLDAEAKKRFRVPFADLTEVQQRQICDDIAYEPKAKRAFRPAARFFARFRDLTASAFYTTPEGMKDIQYVGNVALTKFDGPPPEVLAYLKLT